MPVRVQVGGDIWRGCLEVQLFVQVAIAESITMMAHTVEGKNRIAGYEKS